MQPQRIVNFYCEDFGRVTEETDGKVVDAIGYLSTWAFSSKNYSLVNIEVSTRDYEITARYAMQQDPSKITYVLGGIWHPTEKRYSFHS